MLRNKKYNGKKKNNELNKYFNKISNDFVKESILIKDNCCFSIIKDLCVDLYLWCFKNTILIHLNDVCLDDFEYLYKKSQYKFDIYENLYNGNKIYHIFCISQKLHELHGIDYRTFLKSNDSDYKYYELTKLYGSCLIINKRFNIINDETNYKFVKTIGDGVVNNMLKNNVSSYINYINEYMNILPPHYLV